MKICLKEFVKPENILVGMVEYTSITEIIDPKLLSEGKGQKRDALIQRMEELRLSALEDADKEEAKEINEEVNSALTQINNGTFEVPSLDEQISRVVEEVFEVIRENCAEIQLGRQLQIENFDLSVRVKDLETKVETVFTEAVLGSEYSSREIIA